MAEVDAVAVVIMAVAVVVAAMMMAMVVAVMTVVAVTMVRRPGPRPRPRARASPIARPRSRSRSRSSQTLPAAAAPVLIIIAEGERRSRPGGLQRLVLQLRNLLLLLFEFALQLLYNGCSCLRGKMTEKLDQNKHATTSSSCFVLPRSRFLVVVPRRPNEYLSPSK